MNNDARGPHSPGSTPGHETTDISVRAVAWFLLALGSVLVISGFGVSWFLGQMESDARQGDAPASPVAEDRPPPSPQLQVSAKADMDELRAAQQERLAAYGWVDQKSKMVHIPISEAMERVARDGPPKWPAVEAPMQQGAPQESPARPQEGRP